MHYSAIHVVTSPLDFAQLVRDLNAFAGVEVHYCYPDSGRLIAIHESDSLESQKETLLRIQADPRVLTAGLVYHYLDPEPETAGPEMASS